MAGRRSSSDPRRSVSHPVAIADPLVSVPTPSGDVVLVDPRVHRADVVRRLLAQGVSERTLITMLPGWEPLVRSVVAGEAALRAETTQST